MDCIEASRVATSVALGQDVLLALKLEEALGRVALRAEDIFLDESTYKVLARFSKLME